MWHEQHRDTMVEVNFFFECHTWFSCTKAWTTLNALCTESLAYLLIFVAPPLSTAAYRASFATTALAIVTTKTPTIKRRHTAMRRRMSRTCFLLPGTNAINIIMLSRRPPTQMKKSEPWKVFQTLFFENSDVLLSDIYCIITLFMLFIYSGVGVLRLLI